MPAPLEDVHRHLGRVRELDEEDLLARDVTDGPRVEPTRKHMEGVLTGTQRRVVGHPHDLPRAAVVPDVGRPGQGLERDPHAALVRQLGGLVQLLRGQLVVVDGVGLAARADEDQVGTQLGHDVELALEAPHRPRVLRLGHAFQVAEGLQHLDLETEFVAALPDPAWGPQAAEQVLVEDLDAVEPGVCHRGELLVEGARQGDRGDRPTHSWTVATGMRRGHALADQWQELAGVPPAPLCRGAGRCPSMLNWLRRRPVARGRRRPRPQTVWRRRMSSLTHHRIRLGPPEVKRSFGFTRRPFGRRSTAGCMRSRTRHGRPVGPARPSTRRRRRRPCRPARRRTGRSAG